MAYYNASRRARAALGRAPALSVRFGDDVAVGALLPTAWRGTHTESEALVTEVEGLLVALAARAGEGALRGTAAGREIANRVQTLRGQLSPFRQRVETEDYDFTGTYTATAVRDRLKRLRDEVKGLLASAQRVVSADTVADRSAASQAEAKLVREKAKLQTKSEEDREKGWLDKYGLYLKLGGGLVGLGLTAYLAGPLIRAVAGRAGKSVAAGGSRGTVSDTAGLFGW